jgi:hypothetical protein
MRGIVFAIVIAAVLPIYGQEKAPKPAGNEPHSESANKPTDSETPTAPDSRFVITQEITNNQENQPEKKSKSYFARLFSAENLPNIGLCIIGFFGILYARRTLKKLGDQAEDTKKAADAAKDSAAAASRNTEVLIDIERAWLIPCDGVRPKALPTVRLRPVQTELLVVQIKNFGRTPAWITDFWIDIQVLDNTNIEEHTRWQKPEEDYSSARPVPAGKTEEFSKEWNIRDASTIDDLQAERKHIYVFGYVQYRIALDKKLACSYFCFHYFRRRHADGNFEEGWMMEPPTANHYS